MTEKLFPPRTVHLRPATASFVESIKFFSTGKGKGFSQTPKSNKESWEGVIIKISTKRTGNVRIELHEDTGRRFRFIY